MFSKIHAVDKLPPLKQGSNRMNQQMDFLRNVITTAKAGNPAAIRLLRSVCRTAADKAPDDDLLTMAQWLYDIRREAATRSVERN